MKSSMNPYWLLKLFIIFGILSSLNFKYTPAHEYYWRDYKDGKIPYDAAVVGKTAEKEPFYLGQGLLPEYGIMPGQIIPRIKVIQSFDAMENGLKILCGPSDNFSWKSTNTTNLVRFVSFEPVVIAGWQKYRGTLYFARVFDNNGNMRLGKVHVAEGGRIFVIRDYGKKEEDSFTSYELLVYNSNSNFRILI